MPAAKKTTTPTTKKEAPKNFFKKIKEKIKKTDGPKADRSGLWGKIGFTLSLVSIGTWLIPLLGFSVSVIALVFNILGLKVEKGRWFAVTGLTLAIVTLNLTFVYGFYNVLISMLSGAGF